MIRILNNRDRWLRARKGRSATATPRAMRIDAGRGAGTNARRVIGGALTGLILLAACERESAAKTPGDASEGAGPAMWVASDPDSTVYLFGTFHILPKNARWTTTRFKAAMAETPVTMTEVDTKSVTAQAKMAKYISELGLNPGGVTLSSILGDERARKFAAIAARYDIPMSLFEPLKPWLAMVTLSVMIMEKEGFEAESGAEEAILQRAASEGDRVEHLESAEYQIRALASLDQEEILADFDSSLEQFDEFDAYIARVLDAWTSGDAAALDEEILAPMRGAAPDAFRILITERNRNWAEEIARLMAGDEDYFIAVGAGHLIGEGSVIKLLEEKGFAVERVQ